MLLCLTFIGNWLLIYSILVTSIPMQVLKWQPSQAIWTITLSYNAELIFYSNFTIIFCRMHNNFTPFKYFCANAIILIIAYIYCVSTLQCMARATRKKSREYTGAMTLCIKILEEVLKQHGHQVTKLRLSCWDIKILEEVLKQHGHQVTKLRLSCWDIKSWKKSWTNTGTRSRS